MPPMHAMSDASNDDKWIDLLRRLHNRSDCAGAPEVKENREPQDGKLHHRKVNIPRLPNFTKQHERANDAARLLESEWMVLRPKRLPARVKPIENQASVRFHREDNDFDCPCRFGTRFKRRATPGLPARLSPTTELPGDCIWEPAPPAEPLPLGSGSGRRRPLPMMRSRCGVAGWHWDGAPPAGLLTPMASQEDTGLVVHSGAIASDCDSRPDNVFEVSVCSATEKACRLHGGGWRVPRRNCSPPVKVPTDSEPVLPDRCMALIKSHIQKERRVGAPHQPLPHRLRRRNFPERVASKMQGADKALEPRLCCSLELSPRVSSPSRVLYTRA